MGDAAQHADDPRQGSAGDEGKAHQILLRRAFDEGSRVYGPLPLPFETFARGVVDLTRRWLLRSGAPLTPDRMTGALGQASRADLYLTIACEESVAGAWEVFTTRFVPRLKGLALRNGADEPEAETLARDLPGHLVGSYSRSRSCLTASGTVLSPLYMESIGSGWWARSSPHG